MDPTLTRPSDDTVTRRVIAYIRRPWDRAFEGRNVLTGEPLVLTPVEQVVAFMGGVDIVPPAAAAVDEQPADVVTVDDEAAPADELIDDTQAALRAFGVESVDQLPEFARRQLAGIPCSWRPLRGYGRRGLLNLAWPAKWRRARAANAPHRRIARWGLRAAWTMLAAAVPVAATLLARGV